MREKVLIGSSALEHHLGSKLGREPEDRDYLSLHKLPDADVIPGEGILDQYSFPEEIASVDEVYTLKVSHSPWVISRHSWYKHLRDITLLRSLGATVVEDLHKVAYAEWERRRGAKKVNLKMDKSRFFAPGVKRTYDHDSVHAAVAFGEQPLFKSILLPGEEVLTSRRFFEELSEVQKRQLAQEEVMVLALERSLIPRKEHTGEDPTKEELFGAYQQQLELLITQYSKGWFPRWLIENYEAVRTPPFNFWQCFLESPKKVLLAP